VPVATSTPTQGAQPTPQPGGATPHADDVRVLAALRAGDEAAFADLIHRYHGRLVRLATVYVRDRGIAEEVVQEAWLGVLRGLEQFEGRASLKVWIFSILTNCAKTRARREGRLVTFASLTEAAEEDGAEPAVEPERFRATGPWRGHWISVPDDWDAVPEARILAQETRAQVRRAIDALPPVQRAVITLRDVEQCASDEVCRLLGISEGNQRVLLHRARSKVRRALEAYLDRSTP
jgi:RNA polymerase sigma-70 factor (ECF subfamily)